MERRTLIKALLMLTFMICGMKVEKTIAAENRWDNLITEISAGKKTQLPILNDIEAQENNLLKIKLL